MRPLLVEKDYSSPGFLRIGDDYHLYLTPPKGPHRILSDAINTLIEMVLDKSGDVIFLENNTLVNYERMALISRY